jgi:hypothetical protein
MDTKKLMRYHPYHPGRYYTTTMSGDGSTSYCQVLCRSNRFSRVARKARKLSVSGEFLARLFDDRHSKVILFRKGQVAFVGESQAMWDFLRNERFTWAEKFGEVQ